MFRCPVIIKAFTCLVLLTSCGYHSVNQRPTGACEVINTVTIDNRILSPGFETTVQAIVRRYFKTDADHPRGLGLTVRLKPVITRLIGFTHTGQLGAKVLEVHANLDVMTHAQLLWSVRSQSSSSIIAHRNDPLWSAAAEDVGLREALEKSIAELHMRFEAKCRRRLVEKEAL